MQQHRNRASPTRPKTAAPPTMATGITQTGRLDFSVTILLVVFAVRAELAPFGGLVMLVTLVPGSVGSGAFGEGVAFPVVTWGIGIGFPLEPVETGAGLRVGFRTGAGAAVVAKGALVVADGRAPGVAAGLAGAAIVGMAVLGGTVGATVVAAGGVRRGGIVGRLGGMVTGMVIVGAGTVGAIVGGRVAALVGGASVTTGVAVVVIGRLGIGVPGSVGVWVKTGV
jgi:hypothetical protein